MKLFPADFSYTFLPKLLNMTLTASVMIAAVLILRLCLKRAPKTASYALWAIVLFRLLCPFSVQSELSALNLLDAPSSEQGSSAVAVMEYIPENIVHNAYPSVQLPVPGLSEAVNERLPQGHYQLAADPMEGPMALATMAWMLGVYGMLLYGVISYICLRWKLRFSVPLRENIRVSDCIPTAFVIGIVRPRIYLPSGLSEKEQEYVLLHERHHIRRLDPLWKLLAFLALTLHWFNPLVWLAFALAERDMEMSCDESVIARMGEEIRADYSGTLLSLAAGRRIFTGTPLAFGEGDTKSRIRNLAKWKKPALWVGIAAALVCGIAAVCLLTNPKTEEFRIRITIPPHTENAISYSDEQICPRAGRLTVLIDENEPVGQTTLTFRRVSVTEQAVSARPSETLTLNPGNRAAVSVLRGSWYQIGAAVPNPTDEPMNVYVTVKNVEVRIEDSAVTPASSVLRWFDSREGDVSIPDGRREIDLNEFPGVTFRCMYEKVEAVTETETIPLFTGMPVCSVYFCDMTGDGLPELCSTIAIGSGEIDERIIVYDYATRESWELSDRGNYDFRLFESLGGLYARKTNAETGEIVQVGRLMLTNAAGGSGRRLEIDGSAEKMSAEKMEPVTHELTGAFDDLLFVPLYGAIYRFRADRTDPKVTPDAEIYRFTERSVPEVNWIVYETKEYPDLSVLYAEAGDDYRQVYRYAPAEAADEDELKKAKESECVLSEDGYVTSGLDRWMNFVEQTEQGRSASVRLTYLYGIDRDRVDETYYTAYEQDYPRLFTYDLRYEDGVFTEEWFDGYGRMSSEFRYLRSFDDTIPSTASSGKTEVVHYVLTNDENVTWEELRRRVTSSQMETDENIRAQLSFAHLLTVRKNGQ